MGIKEEITKIAVEQGYEGAKPKTIAGAIDALADTLAGEDVTGSRSISGAVKALAPYIGTGGGGVELGPLQELPGLVTKEPHVGGSAADGNPLEVVEMRIGSQVILGDTNNEDRIEFFTPVAAGVTIVSYISRTFEINDISTYLLTINNDTGVIETIENFDLDVSIDHDHNVISFVMPEWNTEGEQFPVMYIARELS